jgi:hypothetical protein
MHLLSPLSLSLSPLSLSRPCLQSTATTLQITYNPTPVTTMYGTAVQVLSGLGTRVYTNRFGSPFSAQLILDAIGTAGASNLLYLNSAMPVDPAGLTFGITSSIQLPGHGPNTLYTTLVVYNASGVVAEGSSQRVDGLGEAFLSTVPGFLNTTIGASNLNTLAVNYAQCQAPITFTNGLRTPTQPTSFNGAVHISYSYYVTDGVSYSVTGNLTITTASAFASIADQLGNPYQTVIQVTGTRTYRHFASSSTLVSNITGLSRVSSPNVDQRFYPYSLLASSPGVYTTNTAPFLDSNGIGYGVSPSIPVNGVQPGTGPQQNSTSIYFYSTVPTVVLADGQYTNPPDVTFQQQMYTLLQ